MLEAGHNQLVLWLVDDVLRAKLTDPGVCKDLSNAYSLFEILLEHASDEGDGLAGAGLPDGIGEGEGLIEDSVDDDLVFLADKGGVAGE